VSQSWVDASLSPWIKSVPTLATPNYGWYWWLERFGPWRAHVADGWKGQRIAIVLEEHLVVTMTGVMERDEKKIFAEVMAKIRAATASSPLPDNPTAVTHLRAVLGEVLERARVPSDAEPRMVPSTAAKERRRPFAG
jgi:hypothetical protein